MNAKGSCAIWGSGRASKLLVRGEKMSEVLISDAESASEVSAFFFALDAREPLTGVVARDPPGVEEVFAGVEARPDRPEPVAVGESAVPGVGAPPPNTPPGGSNSLAWAAGE